MVIQYASDLHLECLQNREYLRINPIKPVGDILILAGDIVPFMQLHDFMDFFKYLSDHFSEVFWVPGNHEYYGADLNDRSGKVYEMILSNVHLINNICLERGDAYLLFSTLWSQISMRDPALMEERFPDFRMIKCGGQAFRYFRFNELHSLCVNFLEYTLTELNGMKKKKIITTHHVPTYENYPSRYRGDLLNEAFAVDMSDLMLNFSPDYWIYGHHHQNIQEFSIGKTKLITNQLGYLPGRKYIDFRDDAAFMV